MKIKSPVGLAAIVVVGVPAIWLALGASGILLIKNPFPQRANITFSIEDNELIVTAASGNRGNCEPKDAKGCVRVSKWRRAHIRFVLNDMDNWVFSKMQLVAEPTPKLNFGDQAGFTEAMINDFYVKVKDSKVYPDTNGIIDLTGLTKGDEFKLIDRNRFKQIYSYQVRACDNTVNPVVCKDSDPKIINEG